jgi:hypothetical protein
MTLEQANKLPQTENWRDIAHSQSEFTGLSAEALLKFKVSFAYDAAMLRSLAPTELVNQFSIGGLDSRRCRGTSVALENSNQF